MSQILPEDPIEIACQVAETWGFEDALEGLRPRNYAYYTPDSPQETAYLAGYQAATEFIFDLTGKRTAHQLGIQNERFNEAIADWEGIYNDYRHTF